MGDERDQGVTQTDVQAAAAPSGGAATVRERPGAPAASSHDETVDARALGMRPSAPRFDTIGRFSIERTLGEGGMGIVMLAHDATLDRRVAIKLLRTTDEGVGSTGRVRLLREAQAMARLRHPNVVTVFEAGVHERNVYIVMEYIAGGTLRDWLRTEPRPAWRDVLARFVQAGQGLAAAHQAGVVHRDFKPDNVLVDERGEVKVTDFGLATRDDSLGAAPVRDAAAPRPDLDALSHTLTAAGDVMGTPKYMSPEQHEAGATTAHTDQFSFCVALYEALYDQHPFSAGDYGALRAATLAGVVRPPPADTKVPPAIHAAILRGLEREPEARHAAMDALLAALAGGGAQPVPARGGRGVWPLRIGGLAVLVGGIAGIGYLVHGGPDDAPPPLRRPVPIGSPAPVPAPVAIPPPSCDCEVIAFTVPPNGELLDPTGSAAAGMAPNTLALPRSTTHVRYRVGYGEYTFGVVPRGRGHARTIALPVPEPRDGYSFVPGGEVTIGMASGSADDKPETIITLAPYLIETQPFMPGGAATYDRALQIAAEQHARLPTAAEWEWAARSGVIGWQEAHWEWTATELARYPYVDDGRDDELADRNGSEVRGGGSDSPLPRLEGHRTGRAEVRLASTPSYAPRAREVSASLRALPDESDPRSTHIGLSAGDRVRVDRFLVDWATRPDAPPLRVTGGWCELDALLDRVGVPRDRRNYTTASASASGSAAAAGLDSIALALDPDPHYRAPAARPRRVCTDQTISLLPPVCFAGEQLAADSEPNIAAVAATLKGSPQMRVQIGAHVLTDALAATQGQARADVVRAALLAAGIAPERITAKGLGPRPVNAGLFDNSGDEQCPGVSPREGVDLAVTGR